jgi:two-component system, OmpR family, response regulator
VTHLIVRAAPIPRDAALRPRVVAREKSPTKKCLRRILLVEDDPDIQEVTTLLLSDIGSFEVRAYGSAAEALETAEAFDPDLILLDVMMPGLDGQGAFAAFHQLPATAETPVIFMTGRVQPREIMEYRQLGCLGVIPKPFDPDTLADTIQGMWDRHQKARLNEERREDLAAPRTLYAADLPATLRSIEEAAACLRNDGWDSQVAASLYEMAHRLAGSAAIYGFPAVSEAAGRIGAFANEHGAGTWTPVDSRPLLELVTALAATLQQSVAQERAKPRTSPD